MFILFLNLTLFCKFISWYWKCFLAQIILISLIYKMWAILLIFSDTPILYLPGGVLVSWLVYLFARSNPAWEYLRYIYLLAWQPRFIKGLPRLKAVKATQNETGHPNTECQWPTNTWSLHMIWKALIFFYSSVLLNIFIMLNLLWYDNFTAFFLIF